MNFFLPVAVYWFFAFQIDWIANRLFSVAVENNWKI